MIKRLRIKFIIVIMTIVTVLMAVIFGIVLHLTALSNERESIAMMLDLAMAPKEAPDVDEVSEGIRLPFFVVEIDQDGEILDTGGRFYDLTSLEKVKKLVTAARETGEETDRLSNYNMRFLHVKAPALDGREQELYVFSDISNENRMMKNLIRNCLEMMLLGFSVFLIISVFLSYWITRPVAKAWDDQKAFIADASHELKTPLTVMLTNAELLKDPSFSDAERAGFVNNLYTVTQQMRGLVEKLLDLARIDQGQHQHMTKVDFSALVENELLLFEVPFYEAGLEVESHVTPDLRVKGDETQLRQAVDVLLDNARKYSPPNAIVSIQLTETSSGAELSVANTGELIPKETQKKIFKRFYRADDSRKRDGSYGLGLPIAQEIVSQHRGSIGVSTRDCRNIFTIQLPLTH